MSTPAFDPRGYNPFGQDPAFGQVIDRAPQQYGQVIDRGPQRYGQVIDRTRAFDQDPTSYVFGQPGQGFAPAADPRAGVMPGPNIAANPGGDPGGHPGGTNPGAPPAVPPPAVNPFEDWYKNTILAHPEKYDTGISEAQWKAWFPLWTGSGFKSSKVDQNGNPIPGVFDKPDDCPPGMAAFGQNQCRPAGATGGGGAGTSPGGGGAGGNSLTTYPTINWPTMPTFTPPTGATEVNDPGYQFRLDQGQAALAASAAAKGTLNSGGTLLGAQKFGQDYASGEFDKVFQRAKDEYAPKLAQWQIQAQAAKEQASAVYQRMWDEYTFGNLSAAQKAQLQAQMAALQAQIDAMILNASAP